MRNAIKGRMAVAPVVFGSALLVAATFAGSRPLNPDSRLWVEGTSTVRSYKCVAKTLESEIRIDEAAAAQLPLDQLVQAAQVSVAVEALDCSNGTMNGHLQKALKMKEYPRISFNLGSYEIDGDNAMLDGTLEIGGKANPVRIAAKVAEEAGGVVRVQAEHEIRMTEFGIKPPSLMLGTMKVHDPVVIHFDVTLQR